MDDKPLTPKPPASKKSPCDRSEAENANQPPRELVRPTGRPVESERAARASHEHARRLVRTGWWIVLGAIVPIGLWMSLAPLSMAVVAPGFVKVDLNRRPVQHLEGGIVREVFVRDGEYVHAGEPMLRLGDVSVAADRNRLKYRLDVEGVTLARLEAEQSLAETLVFPSELQSAAQQDERIAQALAKEAALFQTRRDSLISEVALMKSERARIEDELAALRAQLVQAQRALALQQQELEANRKLVKDGFVAATLLAKLESTVVDYGANLEQQRAEIARAEQRLIETDLKIKSTQNAYAQDASDQLKESAARLGEIEQELRVSEDAAARQIVKAPASGDVIGLMFTSPGAVIGAGEPIAEIVPTDVALLVEAKIRPEDIGSVYVDQRARVKFTAFTYRAASMVTGRVTYVSADHLIDKATNMPYYSVTILADADSLKSASEIRVQAGMPAEVYIEGTTQTALQYLTAPVTRTLRKAGRQM